VQQGTHLEATLKVHLTDRFCSTAKAKSQSDFFDDTVHGLALRVSPTFKSWTLLYSRPGGKRARLTLGRYPALSLAAARARALEAKSAISEGRPLTATGTLRSVVDDYFSREGAKLRSVAARRSTFDRLILPVLGERPINDIRRSEIVRLLDDLSDNNGPRAAGLAFAYLSKVMNWHATRDDDFRTPLVRGMGVRQPEGRERILSDDELRAVWAASDQAGLFGQYVRFLLLTAVRRSEAANMVRSEVVGPHWTIPAERMKGKKPYVVPLSGAALDVLAKLSGNDELIFPLGDLGRWKEKFDQAVPLPHWTLHDLRRTARSLMSRAGVDKDIGEQCLAHVIGGVRGTYDRWSYLDQKRAAFEKLAALVEQIVGRHE
jgi:integrase